MPYTDWTQIEGQDFDPGEARAASDFNEVARNYGFTPEQAVDWLGGEDLSIGQRLWLTVKGPSDKLLRLVLTEKDDRLVEVAKARIAAEKDGKIILAGV